MPSPSSNDSRANAGPPDTGAEITGTGSVGEEPIPTPLADGSPPVPEGKIRVPPGVPVPPSKFGGAVAGGGVAGKGTGPFGLPPNDSLDAPPDALGQQVLFEGAPPLSVGRAIRRYEPDAIRRVSLDNGLVANLIASDISTHMEVLLVFRSGKLNDPAGKTGLAHFVEHLACPGASLVDPQQRLERALENDALKLRASTGAYLTYFGMRGEMHQAEIMMARLREVFCRPEIPDAIIEREKGVIASERLTLPTPPFIDFVRQEFERFTFGKWGRKSVVIGAADEVKSFTAADLAAYWDSHLVPGNAEITILTGNPARALNLLDTHFSSLPPSVPRSFQEFTEAEQLPDPRPRTLWRQAPYEGAGVILSFPTPAQVDHTGAAAYLAARILAQGSAALIFEKVRNDDGLIYGPAIDMIRTPGGARFTMSFVLQDAQKIDQALGGMESVMKVLHSVDFVRARMNHINWNLREFTGYGIEHVAQNLIYFGESLGINQFQQELFTVTPEEVCAVARQIFDPAKATIAVYTAAPARPFPAPWGV